VSAGWKFARRVKMPSGAGMGWVLINEYGLELCIRHNWRGLLTWQEAVEYANTYVRLLDDLPFPIKKNYDWGARPRMTPYVLAAWTEEDAGDGS
jgi:hypothetical protein